MFRVVATETYLKQLKKWPPEHRKTAEELPDKLAEKPQSGKPLGYPFLREKKVQNRRIYFLVYNDLELVLLVATSGKKDQQATIDHIKDQLDGFKQFAEEISRQLS